MRRLESRVAVVTGGASGLGLAIAERLAAEGARVVITDVQQALGREVAARRDFLFIEHDVCDEARWTDVIAEVERCCGPLRVLVNNAGITGPKDAVNPESSRLADWRRVFAVNVEGVFLGCREALPAMRRAGGGSIVNVSSVAALLATPYATAYGASKAAVRQLTKSVAQHCAEERLGIRCNSVHPGIVRTPFWNTRSEQIAQLRGVHIDEVVAEGRAMIPMGDFTLPEDVAAVVAFLASDEARHITGAKLVVDGGITHCDSYFMNAKSTRIAGGHAAAKERA